MWRRHAAAVVCLGLSGVVWPLTAAAPLADRTVDAGGTPIHLRCGGDRAPGAPLVVLEAGAGNGADTWAKVQPAIAEFARVCAYDRPTLVRGKPARPPVPSPDEIVATLDRVLTVASEPPPYILVGHSFGGMIVRLYATRFPDRVRGVVLIDSSHEDQLRRFEAVLPGSSSTPGPATAVESFDLAAMSAALAAHPWRTTVPLLVLTRGNQPPPPGADPAAAAGMAQRYGIWLDLQNELATRSPHSRHVVAEHSGHYIQNDQPQLVIDGLRELLVPR